MKINPIIKDDFVQFLPNKLKQLMVSDFHWKIFLKDSLYFDL